MSDDTHIGSADGVKPALYPFAGHIYDDAANIFFRLPHERDFRKSKGRHDESAIPMFAWGNDAQEFAFANMTGAIKFSFTNISATMVKFTFTSNGEKMSGLFPLTGLDSGNAADVSWDVATAGNEAEKSLTFYADVVGGTVSFYVPYPAGTLSAGSQVRLEDTDGNALYENTSLKAITVAKNQIVVLPTQVAGAINLAFTEASGEIMNPERGFYTPCQYSFKSQGDNPGRIHPNADLQNGSMLAENSLIHLMFYLPYFVHKETISEDAMNDMREVLNKVRNEGKKIVLRFAYWWDNETKNIDLTDPTLANLKSHISALKPIFTEYEDIIYVVQAGFIGAAPVINKRPMKLMLLRGDSATELADLGDVRELASRTEKDYELTITEPLQSGDKLAIWLPDNATTIQNRPEYAIRLANNETTFEGIGYNVFCTLP